MEWLVHIQSRHFIPALNAWADRAVYMIAHPIAIQFPGRRCMDDLTIEPNFDSQATHVIDVLGLFCDIISLVVCTTRHWRMPGGLVRKLNDGTVVKDNNHICCYKPFNSYFSYISLDTVKHIETNSSKDNIL